MQQRQQMADAQPLHAVQQLLAHGSRAADDDEATLEGAPANVNQDAEGEGWFLKLELANPAELEELMTEEQYKSYLETLS